MSGRARLSSIEALRGAAATAVIFSHVARHLDAGLGAPGLVSVFQAGHSGVDLFFVISGFIILFVHGRDVGRPERLGHYLLRRFNRVFPLYWIVLGLTVAMALAGSHGLPAPIWLLTSASLLPTQGEPLLGIAWTLQFEMVFYAVFAVLIVSRAAGMALLAAWLAWIAASSAGFGGAGVPSALCGIYCVEFFMGMAAAHLLRRGTVPAPGLVAAAGILLFAASYAAESMGALDGFGLLARGAYGGSAMLLVGGLAAVEGHGGFTVPRWMQVLGGASYSIYLFQFVFIGVLWQALLASGLVVRLSLPVLFALLSASAVAGGVVMRQTVERPLLRFIRGRPRAVATQEA